MFQRLLSNLIFFVLTRKIKEKENNMNYCLSSYLSKSFMKNENTAAIARITA